MTEPKTLASDDERVAFAAQLGWEVGDTTRDPGEYAHAADDYFQLDVLDAIGHATELDGVDQPLLDEVRDAVVRRQSQTAVQPGD